jgi:hypothetical protein
MGRTGVEERPKKYQGRKVLVLGERGGTRGRNLPDGNSESGSVFQKVFPTRCRGTK